jgi:hypothetical protein
MVNKLSKLTNKNQIKHRFLLKQKGELEAKIEGEKDNVRLAYLRMDLKWVEERLMEGTV